MRRGLRILVFVLALIGWAGELECFAAADDGCTPITCAVCCQSVLSAEESVAVNGLPATGTSVPIAILAPDSLFLGEPTPPPKTRA